MSEESQVFRGDRGPERSTVAGDAAGKKAAAQTSAAAAAAPEAVATSFNSEPEPEVSAVAELATPATPATVAPQPAPETELKLEVDPSQLWHGSEALRERMAKLHSTAAATAHVLDEQEAEARRIAKQLKSL